MAYTRINGELYILAAIFLQEVDHALGLAHVDGRIFVTMENSKWQRLDSCFLLRAIGHDHKWVPAPANGRHRREPLGILERQAPGPKSAHAQPGQVNTVCVHAIFLCDLVQERDEALVVPPFPIGALRGDKNEWEISHSFSDLGGPMNFY